MLNGLDHVNINTKNLEETRRFFVEVLDFTVGPRPDVPVPGYWLYSGGRPIIHLVDMDPQTGQGPLDHFALSVNDHDAMRAHLERLGVPYREVHLPDGTIKQLVILDPNGVRVELNWRAG